MKNIQTALKIKVNNLRNRLGNMYDHLRMTDEKSYTKLSTDLWGGVRKIEIPTTLEDQLVDEITKPNQHEVTHQGKYSR
jgi:hypothetical protein